MPAAAILVVDDDDGVREVTTQMLLDEGFEVTSAGSAHAARDLLARGERFALIVLDFAMPDLDGVTAAGLIRAQRPDQPLLIITGYYPRGEDSPLGNGQQYLHKPFRQSELMQAVRHLLDRGRSS